MAKEDVKDRACSALFAMVLALKQDLIVMLEKISPHLSCLHIKGFI